MGWYNDKVNHDAFRWDFAYDTLAVLVLSTPEMFEKAFKPFLKSQIAYNGLQDPLDECLTLQFKQIKDVSYVYAINCSH